MWGSGLTPGPAWGAGRVSSPGQAPGAVGSGLPWPQTWQDAEPAEPGAPALHLPCGPWSLFLKGGGWGLGGGQGRRLKHRWGLWGEVGCGPGAGGGQGPRLVDGRQQLGQILLGPKPFSWQGLGGGAVRVLGFALSKEALRYFWPCHFYTSPKRPWMGSPHLVQLPGPGAHCPAPHCSTQE